MRFRFRFSIRELLLLTTIVALAVAIIVQNLAHRSEAARLKREAARGINVAREHEIALINDGYLKIGKHIYRVDNEGYVIFDENSALTPEALGFYPKRHYPRKNEDGTTRADDASP
jgi:hypothetical protein